MLTKAIIENFLADVKFHDWDFIVGEMGDGFSLQVRFLARENDNDTSGMLSRQRGRKWHLSRFMTEGEVLRTALRAVLDAQEHEAREQFTYKGKALFGPHLATEALLQVAGTTEYRSAVAA